jgi:dual-specificity kinase
VSERCESLFQSGLISTHKLIPSTDNALVSLHNLSGQGTYGKVYEAWDSTNAEYAAIKVSQYDKTSRWVARQEITMLATLRQNDDIDENHCLRILECFTISNHVFIVTPRHQKSLWQLQKDPTYSTLSPIQTHQIVRQLLEAVAYLARLDIAHTILSSTIYCLKMKKMECSSID